MKKIMIIASMMVISIATYAQSNMHLYHMKGQSLVGQELNATYFPDAKFYLTPFPLLFTLNSGVSISSPLSYSDIFTPTGDSTRLNVGEILKNGKKHHMLEVSTYVPILGFGFRIKDKATFSFFANVRSSVALGIPYDVARFAWEGNGSYIGQTYEIDDIRLNAFNYGEVGVGYSRNIEVMGRKAKVGGRVKYLIGGGSARINNDANVSISVDEKTYLNTLRVQNATIRVGGVGLAATDDDYEFNSSDLFNNTGFAIDLGAEYEFNEKLNFNFAINDIGSITWRDGKEISIKGGEIEFKGVDLNNVDDLGDGLSDQIDTLTAGDTVTTKFGTPLNTSLYLGATYKLSKNGTAFATYSNYFTLGRMRTAFGVGYMHQLGRILAVSGTVSRTPQFGLDLGAGMSVRFGPFHMHVSAAGIGGMFDVTKTRGVNANFGINWLFGRPVE